MDSSDASNALGLLPLGIPTLVIADDPLLIAATRAAYADWSADTPFSEATIELRLEIAALSPSVDVCRDITVEGSRLWLRCPGANGTADADSRRAKAIMSIALVDDPAALTDVIDTLLLFLLARSGRTPVHASAFIAGELAIVLAGPSGAGKSTLALAAAQRQLRLLSDDMVFVQREPSFALWGFPRPIHLFPGDAPEGEHPTRLRNGKLKSAVWHAAPALKAQTAALVLLSRGNELDIRPIPKTVAIDRLMQLDGGFDLLENDSRAAVEALASKGAWQLTLSDDPGAAIDLVTTHFAA